MKKKISKNKKLFKMIKNQLSLGYLIYNNLMNFFLKIKLFKNILKKKFKLKTNLFNKIWIFKNK